MELTTTTTALFDGQLLPTKQNAENLGKAIAEDARNGFSDLLETVARMKAIQLAAETALAELEPEILTEVAKHGKDGTSILSSIRIEAMEGGVKYDYAKTGDPKWAELKGKADYAASELKDREKFLKAMSKPMAETDMDTGETVELIPPPKSSKATYKCVFLSPIS